MYAQAVRIPPVHLRGKRIQSSAFAQCAKGCAFPDVQLDCIKYLKLGDPCTGSGSTLRAARELGRNSYGFEIDRDFYVKAAEQMLATTTTPPTSGGEQE